MLKFLYSTSLTAKCVVFNGELGDGNVIHFSHGFSIVFDEVVILI